MSKEIKTRIRNKHDLEVNWQKAVNFIPMAGEIIIYDQDATHAQPRIKIGDGTTTVNSLPFCTGMIIEVDGTDSITEKEN